MTRLAGIILLWAAALAAQPGLTTARIGYIRDAAGRLRPLFGLSANFILGEAEHSGVISAACSGRFVLVKAEDSLVLLGEGGGLVERWPAPAGPAVFAFTGDGAPALAFFPQSLELVRVSPEGLEAATLGPGALDVGLLAIALQNEDRILAVVADRDVLWLRTVSLATGLVEAETELAGATGPALLRPDGTLIFSSSASLVVRPPGGPERQVALPEGAVALEQLGEDWVQVRLAGGGSLALRVRPESQVLERLPEAAP